MTLTPPPDFAPLGSKLLLFPLPDKMKAGCSAPALALKIPGSLEVKHPKIVLATTCDNSSDVLKLPTRYQI
jgi:hypothetical protein